MQTIVLHGHMFVRPEAICGTGAEILMDLSRLTCEIPQSRIAGVELRKY